MIAALPKYLARNGWTVGHGIAAGILALLGFWVTRDAWADMLHIGIRDEESSQVLLAPVVAAWLFWVRRGRMRLVKPRGLWIGPALVMAGWILHVVGDMYLIQSFWHGGAVIIVIGCLLSIGGTEVLLKFLPAFAVLMLLVPVPGLLRQQIALPLQTASAQATEVAFELMGMDVQRTGNVLAVNGVQIAIAEACNGLRMVFALTLVSYAFAFGMPLRGYVRFLVVAASPILAIAANVVRLIPTVWFYGYSSESFAQTFHDLSGWVMLPLAFLMLMGIVALLRWALVPVTQYTLAYD